MEAEDGPSCSAPSQGIHKRKGCFSAMINWTDEANHYQLLQENHQPEFQPQLTKPVLFGTVVLALLVAPYQACSCPALMRACGRDEDRPACWAWDLPELSHPLLI